MRGITYPDLAARYEVDVCFDGCFRNDHWGGALDRQGVVHWADRIVRRPGLRRFLILASRARAVKEPWDGEAVMPKRQRQAHDIWFHALWAYRTAFHDLGVRLPASLARADKEKIRALLRDAPFEMRESRVGRWAGLR